MYYEHADLYTDRIIVLGFNMQLRDNWGYEINIIPGRAKDRGVTYDYFEASLGSWYNVSPSWEGQPQPGLHARIQLRPGVSRGQRLCLGRDRMAGAPGAAGGDIVRHSTPREIPPASSRRSPTTPGRSFR